MDRVWMLVVHGGGRRRRKGSVFGRIRGNAINIPRTISTFLFYYLLLYFYVYTALAYTIRASTPVFLC
jgi:hypothetical protein